MAVLTAKTRAKIPTAKFALAGRRFPVHDKVHARVAKSYASRMVKRGQLSSASAAKVNAAANRTLGKSGKWSGGRMRLANGSPSVNDSGRTKKRMRLRYATGGPVNPVGYEGMRGQKRLKGNPNHEGGFARFEGDGEGG